MIKPSTETYQSLLHNRSRYLYKFMFVDFWESRDESKNFEQNYDSEIVREEKLAEVVDEVRLEVDALMREELKNLKAVCIIFKVYYQNQLVFFILGNR